MSDSIFPNSRAEEVIREYAKISGIENVTLFIKPGSAKGNNFTGQVFKVKVQGTKEDKEKSLDIFVKTAPVDENARENLLVRDVFKREIYFYKNIVPVYEQLLDDFGITNEFRIKFPQCLRESAEEYNEFLVMQDLFLEGYTMDEPKSKPLDLNHLRIAMETLAKLHCLSFVLQNHNQSLFEDIIEHIPELLWIKSKTNEFTKEFVENLTKQALSTLQESPDWRFLEKFGKISFESMCAAVIPNKYSVICHGDYWKCNMLFKYDDTNHPTSVIPLDYQVVRYASPATDILNIIFLCTNKELRDKEYTNILEIYFEALKLSLDQFSLKIENVFPKEEFMNEIRRVGPFAMGMAIIGLVFITTSGEELAGSEDAFNDQIKWEKSGKSFVLYKDRLASVLRDCIALGFLEM